MNTVKDIYGKLPLKNVSMVNYGDSNSDPVSELIRKVALSVKNFNQE